MLDKPILHELFHPKLRSPTFVFGLPGFGNVGKIAAHLLIKFAGAKLFAEYYSPFFSDYAIVSAKGICRAPRYEFHASSMEKTDFIILTGDMQPSLDDFVAHYDVCDEILDFVENYDPKLIVALGGVPLPQPAGEVYVAATSLGLAAEVVGKGAVVYGRGRIMGATGLFLGLAKRRGLDGLCLLGATTGFKADRGAGFSVFKFLMKVLGADVKEGI